MRALSFKIGDKAFAHFGGRPNKLVVVTIVHIFERHGREYYIVESENHIEYQLDVRCGLELSDSADLPVGMWRGMKE